MKLNKWLYGAAALAMLAACSDKDMLPETGGTPSDEGSGYVGVQIQLPTMPTTRANDTFDDGVASEYKLNDAVILLFQGPDAATAVCQGAFELKRSQLNADKDEAHNQITTQVNRVANVTGMTINETQKLFALVIANGGSHNFYNNNDENFFVNWMKKSDGVTGKTIQELQETILTNDLYTQATRGVGYASEIVMVNSPLATVAGGKNNPGTINEALPVLVELKSKVYPTEADALNNPAGTIHIERAVGKITCSNFNKNTDIKVTIEGTEYTLEADEIYWDMAQDLANTYIVRNTNRKPIGTTTGDNLWRWNYSSAYAQQSKFSGNDGIYRMLGHTEIEADNQKYYRPYFCQVPGYGIPRTSTTTGEDGTTTTVTSDNREQKSFTKSTMNAEDAVAWKTNSAFYPRENTFPVKFMKYANTTRIGFWVTFKFKDNTGKYLDMTESKDIFTKGLDKSTLYVRNAQGYDPLTAEIIETLKNNADVKQAVEDAMNKNNGTGYANLDLGKLLDFTYDEKKLANTGEIVITAIKFKDDLNDKVYTDDYEDLFNKVPQFDFTDLLAGLNGLNEVYVYQGGKVFYEVRIKHFGDDLTPWDVTAHDQASTIEQSYGPADNNRNANYLGRYGIVRNNWYELNITAITKLGDPQDPAKWDGSWPGKPDDNKDEYIAVVLRVLSWAKRTQSVTF